MIWRSMDDPPSEPMMVLLFYGSHDRLASGFSEQEPYRDCRYDDGYWDGEQWRESGTGHDVFEQWAVETDNVPTHWTRLPPPPTR